MKYSQFQGAAHLDWRAALTAVDQDDFSELDNLWAFARQWPTCACGQLDVRIPRYDGEGGGPTGEPMDKPLFKLGCDFMDAISKMKYNEDDFEKLKGDALELLTKIEAREQEILTQLSPP